MFVSCGFRISPGGGFDGYAGDVGGGGGGNDGAGVDADDDNGGDDYNDDGDGDDDNAALGRGEAANR